MSVLCRSAASWFSASANRSALESRHSSRLTASSYWRITWRISWSRSCSVTSIALAHFTGSGSVGRTYNEGAGCTGLRLTVVKGPALRSRLDYILFMKPFWIRTMATCCHESPALHSLQRHPRSRSELLVQNSRPSLWVIFFDPCLRAVYLRAAVTTFRSNSAFTGTIVVRGRWLRLPSCRVQGTRR